MDTVYEEILRFEDEKAKVRVLRPVLSDEERQRRHKIMEKAAVALLEAQMRINQRTQSKG